MAHCPHAIGEPEFQRQALSLLHACIADGRVPAWHAAYLEDRIAMYEGRPYGTQWMDDPTDGLARPWTLADPKRVDELRAQVGLEPLRQIPEQGPELPAEKRRQLGQNYRWWQEWLASKGWGQSLKAPKLYAKTTSG
jgi:hypothetical protein